MLLESELNATSSLFAAPRTTTNASSSSVLGLIFDSDFNFRSVKWTKLVTVTLFIILILTTIIGNTLVILSVIITKRLRTVTNCFVMNLAITDWLVGVFVMPPAVTVYVFAGSWRFGWILCDVWISLDILLCTGSIWSLCAISLDRYLAVIQPFTYSKKRRSKRLALRMIFIVWLTALLITCPPFLGWYEVERWKKGYTICRYNQNQGYVVFSAMGSFFIPLGIMLYVYVKIGYILTFRRQQIVRDAVPEKRDNNEVEEGNNFLIEMEHIKCITSKCQLVSGAGENCHRNCDGETTHQTTIVQFSRFSSITLCSTHVEANKRCPLAIRKQRKNVKFNRSSTLPVLPQLPEIHIADHRTSFSESRVSSAKLRNQTEQGHSHQQESFRIPMRVSTTKRDSKTAKTLSIVMGGFIACWLPFFVYYLLIPFLPTTYVSASLMCVLTWIGWVNCAINPFIYAFHNQDFRTAFWRLTFHKLS